MLLTLLLAGRPLLLLLLLLLPLLPIVLFYGARAFGRTQRKQRILRASQVPNVSRLPLVGSSLQLLALKPDNLHQKFKEFVQRHGKTFYANIFGAVIVVTAESRYVDALLTSQQHVRKHFLYNMLRSWLGNGLLLSYGTAWQAMRRIITPTFHFTILEQFVEVFERQSATLVSQLQAHAAADQQRPVDIYPLIGLTTLDIITETAMGVRVNAQLDAKSEVVQAIKDLTNVLATRFVRPHLFARQLFRVFWPSGYAQQAAGIQLMHAYTDAIIERRRRELLQQRLLASTTPAAVDGAAPARLALLDVLLQAHDAAGAPLSDTQIRDEVNTFIFEGHDTTTSATACCLYLISRHPAVQQRLFDELQAHFGADLTRSVRYSDLQALNYLHCVVREALRIYPPIPAIGRWLSEDLVLDNKVCLPAGCNVIILLWQLLRDPDVFAEPDAFRPERHLLQTTGVHAYSNIPFSAGPRNCIGQRFALLEVKTVVVQTLRHYELLPLGADLEPSIKIVLRSKTGVNLGVRPRSYSQT